MATDLITQVHSEEDENGHNDHLDAESAHPPSFWSRFLGCLLCKAKAAPPPPSSQHHHAKPTYKAQPAPVQLQPSHYGNSSSASSASAAPSGAASLITQVSQNNKAVQQAPLASIPMSSPPPPVTAMNGGAPPSKYLLPPLAKDEVVSNKKTLVLDLDETLVHSSFKPIPNADFVLSIDLEGVIHRVYVRKRPGVDHFLRYCAEKFEVVVFTASLAKYADPLLDILDRDHTVRVRLFREACVQHYGNYVKDLTHLGRKLENTIIVDNSPFSYMFQPENAIPITSWFNDKSDRQLYDLLPHLDHMADCSDVIAMLAQKKLQFVNGQVLLGS